MREIRWFNQVSLGDAALVGGKGANLGELTRAGLPVPSGFILTTAARQTFLKRPAYFGGLLNEAYSGLQAMCGNRVKMAVRSSATKEDGDSNAFAGMHDTFLNVSGINPLLSAILRCWDSINNDRAIEYRARNGIGGDEVAMAVVVQQMIPAQHAGVAFTIDPILHNPGLMVVEAVAGLGEQLVSGTVTPDEYVLAKSTLVVMSRDGDLMDDAALRTLGGLLVKIEQHYGTPQDVEWCEVDGEFFIVQSRPVTGGQ